MPKAFLSHSSKEKKTYVDIVARQLGYNNCIYDGLTFEEGMKTLEEIEKGLSKSDLFVIFLSDSALNSDWVSNELAKANQLLSESSLKRIYPIIIDPNINYKDRRIPDWLKNEYNLKYISRPTIATRRIKQRLREISWDIHPSLKKRQSIFVGRNELIQKFEERISSLDLATPFCLIASGLNKIGRKVYLKHSLKKSNNIDDAYDPPLIKLSSHESIEDFILKLYDLGLSEKMELSGLMTVPTEKKIELVTKLINDVHLARDLIFIDDNGCIVTPYGKIVDWFEKILMESQGFNRITFCLASSFRLHYHNVHSYNNLFYVNIPELDPSERTGLLKSYSEFEGLILNVDNLKFFAGLQTGFPEQVFYTISLIKDRGLKYIEDNTYLIVDFNSERVNYLLSKYEDDENAMNFLHLLSSYDYISYDYIFEIVEDNEYYKNLLLEFINCAICEHLGANKEYLRVNDTIRDYVLRIRFEIDTKFKTKIKAHLKNFLSTYENEEKDALDLFISLKEALIHNEEIDEKYLIPSHFLHTMKELYDIHKRYDDIVKLAERVLTHADYIDPFIIFQIRYYLCLSLAKMRDDNFKTEVMKISGPEHNFLFGFYYRQIGKYSESIERLTDALKERPEFQRAKRELVQSYINIEEFDKALDLARQNYNESRNNPYHIQAYFICLIRSENKYEHEQKVIELLKNLEKITSDKAKEMVLESLSLYYAIYKRDKEMAMKKINESIDKFPFSPYNLLTKFELCERFRDFDEMKLVLDYLNKIIHKKSNLYTAYLQRKATYLAYIGRKLDAQKILSDLRNVPKNILSRLYSKIEQI